MDRKSNAVKGQVHEFPKFIEASLMLTHFAVFLLVLFLFVCQKDIVHHL